VKKLLIVFVIFNLTFAFAQKEIESQKDIKVGLVLSGGGAKGFAHIGVLKILEEAGVRIDYIGGTSMGAIIGGLYASGYNAYQLDSILIVNDLSGLIQDKLPRRASSFYQKENMGKYAITLPVKNWKIGLPSAVSKGQNVYNVFSQLTESVHDISDFSKLPIPFYSIATDLETGEEVVLDKGFLPEAIRASGSFPGLLAPVNIDDRILVDGGLVNNYPVERMKEMGVDYIIGVDVQGKLLEREDLKSLPTILMQIAGFQMYNGREEKIKITDLYLKPDILSYTNMSFDKSEEIVIKGEEIARKNFAKLKKIADQQLKSDSHRNVKIFDLKDEIIIKEIEINGNKNYTDNYCIDKLKIDIGESISHKKFMEGINALTATGNFQSIQYKFIPVDGGSKIEFEMIENEVSAFLQFGAHYDDLYKTGILVNLTKKHLLLKNDFLSADFIIGDNLRYNIDYILDNGFNWSIGLNTRYNRFKQNIVTSTLPELTGIANDSGLKVPVEYNDFTTQLFVQTAVNNNFALRLGVEVKSLNVLTQEVVNDDIKKLYFDKSNYFNLFGKITFDSYDTKDFPKKGFYLGTTYKVYLISDNIVDNFNSFAQLYGKIGFAHTIVNKLTFHLISQAGITIGNNGNPIHNYHLGGNNENFINTFVPFYGYDVAELNDTAFLRSALTVRYELFENNFLSFTGNFARLDEDLWNNGRIFEDTKSGYAVGYGLKSFIGPIELTYSWNPDRHQNFWYINVGFWF
jgi:NTE family protein